MSIDTAPRDDLLAERLAGDLAPAADVEPAPQLPEEDEQRHGNVAATCLAAFLAAAGAGWMAAGVFEGTLARLIAIAAPLVGAGTIAVSYRTTRPSFVQHLTLPLALVAGAAMVALDPAGRGASLPALVAEALQSGGIAQPPVPLDPGWRFLLTVALLLVGAAAAALATGLDRPRIAVAVPVPLLFVAALAQPAGAELTSTVVGLALTVGALAVAYGVELGREGATSGKFELRRLARGLVAIVALCGALIGLATLASSLLPEPREQEVIPPQRPEPPPPIEDRELFTVTSERVLPLRLGVLDVYDDDAWMTPPFDPARYLELESDGDVPGAPSGGDAIEATFEVADLAGRAIPHLGGARRLTGLDVSVEFDPRTQALRLPQQRASQGLTYTVVAAAPPTAETLDESGPPPSSVAEFLTAPPPPAEVTRLLARAPEDASDFGRLQFVRQLFYRQVVAAGAGSPVDVPPARVAAMLQGEEATPYEITAGEALLARWAGVPSRIGYGYYGGDEVEGDETQRVVRPVHGAMWLEVYFDASGWIPLVGRPARAQSSLTDAETNPDPAVRPTDELALIVLVPVRLHGIQLLYTLIRYYALRVGGVLLVLVAVRLVLPALLRAARRSRRRRWATRAGPRARVAVAYAELRDLAIDLNIGQPSQTPLEFVDAVSSDREHRELAWLATRALWGDLARDVRDDDAAAADEMSRSVQRRLRQGQQGIARLVAFASTASLRRPYSRELPGVLPRRRRGSRRSRRRELARQLATGLLLLVVGAGALVACASEPAVDPSAPPPQLPERLVPNRLGDVRFRRERGAEAGFAEVGEDALVSEGRVFSIRRAGTVEGSLQFVAFVPEAVRQPSDLVDGILRSIGAGQFEPTRVGDERLYELRLAEQRLLLWFPPSSEYYVLMVARRSFAEAATVFASVLAYQRGDDPSTVAAERVPPLDPRRGVPG